MITAHVLRRVVDGIEKGKLNAASVCPYFGLAQANDKDKSLT
jgi:hypothetical protein